MGEVWKADDTKLDRTVALKFLGAHLLNDDEAKQRFLREAKAAASLDHPNICTVHEIDEVEGKTFLSMAFLKGETLEDRIAQGPLPINDALDIGRQVAEGLQAAHAEGVVHRDIKPANILVSPDGRATIMDFGLARLTEASRLTKAEQTVGTAAYMSPEQMQGGEVDHRTDVWALGCVLYEMVAGVRPFKGEYQQALAYEIVSEEPEPLTGVRTGLPMELEFIVGKCLAKDASDRYQHASEIGVDLRTLSEKLKSGRSTIINTSAAAAERPDAPSARSPTPDDSVFKRKFQAALALAALTTLALALLAFRHFNEQPAERPLQRWSFATTELRGDSDSAISPDGKHIAYVAKQSDSEGFSLWVRDLDQLEPRELEGTIGASGPSWSPDSQFIGYFHSARRELMKIAIEGGSASVLCKPPGFFLGGSWSPDGESVVFSANGRIYEVPVRGGEPRRLFEEPVELDRGDSSIQPRFLPLEAGARSLLMAVGSREAFLGGSAGVDPSIVLRNLETGEHTVLADGWEPVYSPSGHIVYQSEDEPWALPFSIESLKATGEAFPIGSAVSSISISTDGTMITGPPSVAELRQLIFRDRTGQKVGEIGQPQEGMRFPVLSPNGRYVAVEAREKGNRDIWVHEVERPAKRRLTVHEADDGRPQWSPSGDDITFQSSRGVGANKPDFDIWSRAADGAGDAEVVVATDASERPFGWSRNGRYQLYTLDGDDLWYRRRADDGQGLEAVDFLSDSFESDSPMLSPDGAFIAYCSNQSGKREVYVRPFPAGDSQTQVSTNGGCQPRWSADGSELFYVENGAMMAVTITTTPTVEVSVPQRLFADPSLRTAMASQVPYDVSPDGRFLMTGEAENPDEPPPVIYVTENWFEEFRDRK